MQTAPLKVQVFEPDRVPPVLLGVHLDLNLDAPTLSFIFDEIINVSAIDVTKIIITNNGPTSGSGSGTGIEAAEAYHALTRNNEHTVIWNTPEYADAVHVSQTSTCNSVDGTHLTVHLSTHDVNRLAETDGLAKSAGATFITLLSGAFVDMNGVANEELIGNEFTSFTPDKIKPTLKWFSIDMRSRGVTMYFSETVRVSTFKPDFLTMMDSIPATASHKLSSDVASSVAHLDREGVFLSFSIIENDMNIIKQTPELMVDGARAFLEVAAEGIFDNSGNPIDTQSTKASHYERDSVRPYRRDRATTRLGSSLRQRHRWLMLSTGRILTYLSGAQMSTLSNMH
jgi:hypothetical protein